MVQAASGAYGSLPLGGETRKPSARTQNNYLALAGVVAATIAVVGCVLLAAPSGPVALEARTASLEASKLKYDSAKQRVAALHKEFDALKMQLKHQVGKLDHARGNLVTQIKAATQEEPTAQSFGEDTFGGPSQRVSSLRDSARTIAMAGETDDAADAAKHALSYTQQVASRVGDLADQSEHQAEKIVDAARLTHEAKDAMRAALEQSSQIVDYNTHAAQAVAQDSGFVTTAAQTISGYLHNIFHDSQAVHQAAMMAVKHMNDDVTSADHAVSEIESDAQEAAYVLQHLNEADQAATGFAQHARSAAVTAATAANGALKGERASMVAGLKSVASAHSAKAGAQAAMEYARAAQAAVHPFVYGQPVVPAPMAPPMAPTMAPPTAPAATEPAEPAAEPAAAGEEGAPIAEAKEMVDEVVMLMMQLTNALETSGDDCGKVEEILTYYQAQMGRYLAQGQQLYGRLDNEDIDLLTQYAQTKVAGFASSLETSVRSASATCSLPVSSFIPTASFAPAMKAAPAKASLKAAVHAPDAASLKIKSLKQELKRVQAQRKVAAKGGKAPAAHAAKKPVVAAAVEAEREKVKKLKAQVAELKAEAKSMDNVL